MPLENMKAMLSKAAAGKYAVGAFNVLDYNSTKAVVQAAEELRAPVIIQTSAKTVTFWGSRTLMGWVKELAARSRVPVAVHLDHCKDLALIKECIEAGWTSVMIDASARPFEENLFVSRQVVEMARPKDVTVEAELGAIVGVEDDIHVKEQDSHLADPAQAVEFCAKVQPDCFAPAIGTAHGIYKGEPKIAYHILQEVAASTRVPIALHGGTAINFFVRGLPRLSVDIDLTYLPVESREDSLGHIGEKLRIIAQKIRKTISGVRVEEKIDKTSGAVIKLFANQQGALVKIEPNLIIRGAVSACEERELSKEARDLFEKSVSVKTLSFQDLYGSKICAALDRQHCRDFFDVKILLENEGITEAVRKSFLVYLISHNRPMYEVLAPRLKDLRPVFEKEFSGMTRIAVTCEELERVRKELIAKVRSMLPPEEREFLVSFKERNPKWQLLGVEGAERLPAVRWKLANLEKIERGKHKVAVARLKKVLGLS